MPQCTKRMNFSEHRCLRDSASENEYHRLLQERRDVCERLWRILSFKNCGVETSTLNELEEERKTLQARHNTLLDKQEAAYAIHRKNLQLKV